jgi:hypothetical protein
MGDAAVFAPLPWWGYLGFGLCLVAVSLGAVIMAVAAHRYGGPRSGRAIIGGIVLPAILIPTALGLFRRVLRPPPVRVVDVAGVHLGLAGPVIGWRNIRELQWRTDWTGYYLLLKLGEDDLPARWWGVRRTAEGVRLRLPIGTARPKDREPFEQLVRRLMSVRPGGAERAG